MPTTLCLSPSLNHFDTHAAPVQGVYACKMAADCKLKYEQHGIRGVHVMIFPKGTWSWIFSTATSSTRHNPTKDSAKDWAQMNCSDVVECLGLSKNPLRTLGKTVKGNPDSTASCQLSSLLLLACLGPVKDTKARACWSEATGGNNNTTRIRLHRLHTCSFLCTHVLLHSVCECEYVCMCVCVCVWYGGQTDCTSYYQVC